MQDIKAAYKRQALRSHPVFWLEAGPRTTLRSSKVAGKFSFNGALNGKMGESSINTYKYRIFHCHVWLPEGTVLVIHQEFVCIPVYVHKRSVTVHYESGSFPWETMLIFWGVSVLDGGNEDPSCHSLSFRKLWTYCHVAIFSQHWFSFCKSLV